MKVLILNQYIPPDPSPTSRLIGDLGEYLTEQGHEVRYVSAGVSYREPRSSRLGRWFRELRSLASMAWRSLTGPRPDVVISLSSPPCLLVLATVVAGLRRAKSVHWAMDLYPELALALQEIGPGFLATSVRRLMTWGYRRCALVVALDEDMREHLSRFQTEPEVIPPWLTSGEAGTVVVEADAEWTWLYSGNLGRAHEWRALLEAQSLLEKRGVAARLVFQGGGPSFPQAQAVAVELGLQRCEFRDYAPAEDLVPSLLSARVLIVTQKPETRGFLWPSKLALVTRLPRSVAWVGPTSGAVADALSESGDNGIFDPRDVEGLADWVEGKVGAVVPQSKVELPEPKVVMQPWLEKWTTLLAEC